MRKILRTEINESERLVMIIEGSIKYYLSKYSIRELYNYKFSVNNSTLFEKEEINKINNSEHWFQKNDLLKSIINNKFSEKKNKLEYYNWIVREWGGIKTFKKTIKDIDSFLLNIKSRKLNYKQYNTISSYSKIISFIEPSEYFIFDSRVAYVLNWLLLKNYKKENKYFFIPQGRNADLLRYNMDTIIHLYQKENVKKYYEKNHAYFIYCDFIKLLFDKVKNNIINRPYYIEMVLFGLFDIISQEVKDKVKIVIE